MSRGLRLLLGIIGSNAVGFFLCASVQFLGRWADIVALPSFILIPMFIGAVAQWIWNPLNLRTWGIVFYTAVTTLFGVTASAIIFKEGAICLAIVSPILYVGVLSGAVLTRSWFRRRRDWLNVCLAPLIALAILAEPSFREPQSSVVTDETRIEAPPAKVWPHILAFEPIRNEPNYWLFRMGLPYPIETTNGGNFVGADRACVFSGGAVFREKVIELEPERLLTFEIVEQPADPELIGHLDTHRGQFELRANADGSTTLIGRTWYTLHVSPEWYFDWWTHDIFRGVHLRVMNNVKKLAEGPP